MGGLFIASKILPDGTALEVLRGKQGTALLAWDGRNISRHARFLSGKDQYRPCRIPQELPTEITLATGTRAYGNGARLFGEISALIRSALGLQTTTAELGTCFVFATYFAEILDLAPRLVIAAEDSWYIGQFLRVMARLCRHALPTAVWDPGRAWLLPEGCHPTFLISDPAPPSASLRLLQATQPRDFVVSTSGRYRYRAFSGAIGDVGYVLSGETPGTYLHINAVPSGSPTVSSGDLEQAGQELRNKLLLYRLQNWAEARKGNFDAPTLEGGTRALAASLSACFPRDPELQSRVIALLEPEDQARRLEGATSESSVVLEALLVACHESRAKIHVGGITELANGILNHRGDGYRLQPRRVGAILRALGLKNRRDGRGYALLLTTECSRVIHELGYARDLPFFKADLPPCATCQEVTPCSPA